MSRIRTVKPEFWTSEQVMECSPMARLTFIGMWNFCDDNGVHPASCKTLKAQIFPADDFTAADIQKLINELLQQRLLLEFLAEDRAWWWVTGWRHQLINRPSKSRFPLPPGYTAPLDTHGTLTESSLNAHGVLTECSLTEGKGREGKRKGKEKTLQEQETIEVAESVGAQAPFATATTDPKPGLRPAKNFPPAPDWLPADTWQAFIDHRKAKRKTMTPQSAVMILRDLDKARSFGHDPVTLIESAIGVGWTGCVFPDKHHIPAEPQPPRNGQRPPVNATKHDHLIDHNRQALNAWLIPQNVIEGECHEVH
jgi:hypothetical protein